MQQINLSNKISRRKFLGISISLATLLLGNLFIFNFKWTIRKIIEQDCNNVNFSNNLVDSFITQTYNEHLWNQFSLFKRSFISLYTYLPVSHSWPFYWKYKQYRSYITGNFLFATDYFNVLRKSEKVNFQGIRNPLKAPCAHPFAAVL